jgi:phage shock protein PspC (stress-responsive transcriptional regulator)
MTETHTETQAIKELHRSRDDRMLAGVCGGLGRYFDLNPVFFRVGFVVLALLGGSGILVYGAAALVIPNDGQRDSIAVEALRNRRARPWPLIGLALVAIASIVLLSHASLWPDNDFLWIVVLVAGGMVLWAHTRDLEGGTSATAAPPPDGTSPTQPIAPRRRRRHPVLRAILVTCTVLMVLALAAIAIAFAKLDVSLSDGVGDRQYHVETVDNLKSSYELGIGDLDLDLSDLVLPKGTTHLDAHVGIGDLRVTVPRNTTVHYDAVAKYGETDAFREEAHGHNNGLAGTIGSGDRVLVVHATVGAGQVSLDRTVR